MIEIPNLENTSLLETAKTLIEILTKEDEEVLDPFAGSGHVLAAATLCRRYAVGIDLYPESYERYRHLLLQEGIIGVQAYYIGDALEKLPTFDPANFSLILTDLPVYGKYPAISRPHDFSISLNESLYLHLLHRTFEECYRVLKPRKYLVPIIRNSLQKDSIIARATTEHFSFQGEVLWKKDVSLLLLKKEDHHG